MRSSRPARQDTYALVMADIEGSTRLTIKLGDLAVSKFLSSFHNRVRRLASKHQGKIVKFIGDGFFAIFRKMDDAVKFSLQLRAEFTKDKFLREEALGLRIGIHVGPVHISETPYGEDAFGSSVNLVARLEGLARPGDILISQAATEALSPEERRRISSGEVGDLKGVGRVAFNRLELAS